MKTLNNFRFDNSFEEITIGQVTICSPSAAVYKLTLPIDDGDPDQVLTTDGTGVTSWTQPTTGTVTSIDIIAPSFLDSTGGPITDSGSITLAYNGTPLPTLAGGTGSTLTSTGTGGVVLSKNPYIRGDGALKYLCQFQENTNVDSSIAITTGEANEANLFFGTNFDNIQTGAHKVAIISDGQNSFSRADLHLCVNNASDNTTSASTADSKLKIDYINGNVTLANALITNNNGDEFIYEEGSWTPGYEFVLSSTGLVADHLAVLTNSFFNGSYIRVGKKITVFFDMGFDVGTDHSDSPGDRESMFVCISGLPFKCNRTAGSSNFGNRNQLVESSFPDGFIGTVPAPAIPVYGSPFEAVVWGEGELVPMSVTAVALNILKTTWTATGEHIIIYSANSFNTVGLFVATANNALNNFNLTNTGDFNGLRFKGSVDYFIA